MRNLFSWRRHDLFQYPNRSSNCILFWLAGRFSLIVSFPFLDNGGTLNLFLWEPFIVVRYAHVLADHIFFIIKFFLTGILYRDKMVEHFTKFCHEKRYSFLNDHSTCMNLLNKKGISHQCVNSNIIHISNKFRNCPYFFFFSVK